MTLPLSPTARPGRIDSVDALRGLVMIIMALDHVRDFLHRAAMTSSPTDLRVTTPLLFMTRWVTHLCAPVFMLTAGLGAYFYWRASGRTRRQLSWFLVTRGAWLIVLELTIMQLAYNFDVGAGYPIFLLVLWVLGACMMVLAALVWLPLPALLALSVLTIALHNFADGITARSLGWYAPLWVLLHEVGAFPFMGRTLIAAYPLVPWVAVMSLGFCLGPIYSQDARARQSSLVAIGAGLTIAFVVVRALNIYGDPAPWAPQASTTLTALSFLNTSKYPPSLAFLLMTLGPALVLLGLFDARSFSRSNPLIVFGRVPLFYFVLHFYAAHAAAVLLAVATYGSAAWGFMLQPVPSMGGPPAAFPPEFGYDLWVTYVVWLAMLAALYVLCARYARYKSRSSRWWTAYL